MLLLFFVVDPVLFYKELFSILTYHARRLQLRFHPQTITTDFESAMIKTIADEVSSVLFSLQLMIYLL